MHGFEAIEKETTTTNSSSFGFCSSSVYVRQICFCFDIEWNENKDYQINGLVDIMVHSKCEYEYGCIDEFTVQVNTFSLYD